jgi:hypothetical protein
VARAVIEPERSELPYAAQHEAVADWLRATGLDVEITPPVERPSRPPNGLVLLQAEVVIWVPGDAHTNDFREAIAAAMMNLSGRVKLGPRRGERRRVQIVDGDGNVTFPFTVPCDE